MNGVPGGQAAHDGDTIEYAGKLLEQPGGQLQVIRIAADVEIVRRPRAFLCVEGVYLAHAAFDVDEQNLARRAHRSDFLLSADIERSKGVEITGDQADATDAQQFTPGKSWNISLIALHSLMNLRRSVVEDEIELIEQAPVQIFSALPAILLDPRHRELFLRRHRIARQRRQIQL